MRSQWVRCGNCRACLGGLPSHGPYYYAEWRGRDLRTHTQYIGVELPRELTPAKIAAARRRGQRWITYER